jgi:hypothetical protein
VLFKLCLGLEAGIMLTLILAAAIGFGGGFWVREWISRRRRAAAREEYFLKHPERRHV